MRSSNQSRRGDALASATELVRLDQIFTLSLQPGGPASRPLPCDRPTLLMPRLELDELPLCRPARPDQIDEGWDDLAVLL